MPVKNVSTQYRVQWVDKTTVHDTLTGNTTVTSAPGSYLVTKSASVVSATNKDWRRRIKVDPVLTGELHVSETAINRGVARPFFTLQVSHGGANKDRYITTRSGLRVPSLLQNAGHDLTLIDEVRNGCTKRMLKKYHTATRSIQGIVALGELGETLALLRRPSDALWKLTKAFMDRRDSIIAKITRLLRSWGGAPNQSTAQSLKRLLLRLNQEYLAYMFGIRPLAADIEGLVEHYNAFNERKSAYVVIKASFWKEALVSAPSIRTIDHFCYSIKSVRMAVSRVEIKMRGGIKAAIGPGGVASGLSNSLLESGFSLRDIVPGLWELLPLSFVSDYFSNIGDIFDGWAFGDVFPEGLQETVIRTATETDSGFAIHQNTANPSYVPRFASITAGAEYQYRKKTIDRTRLPGLPVPTLEFSLPENEFSAAKYRNIAALIIARGSRVRSTGSSNFWSQGINL